MLISMSVFLTVHIYLLIDLNCTLTRLKQMGRTPGYLCPQREDSQRSSTRREGARR